MLGGWLGLAGAIHHTLRRARFVLTLTLAAALAVVGGWGHAVARGYEAGKRDAEASFHVSGVVVLLPDATCHVYEGGQPVNFVAPARTQVALLIRPVR